MRDFQPVKIETHLSRIPLFESLAPDEIARMAKGTREVRVSKGRAPCFDGVTLPPGFMYWSMGR